MHKKISSQRTLVQNDMLLRLCICRQFCRVVHVGNLSLFYGKISSSNLSMSLMPNPGTILNSFTCILVFL